MPEHVLYQKFIDYAPEHRPKQFTPLEWLLLQRHYGMPSRLLDWTKNILVATYFAVGDEDSKNLNDGLIYFFDSSNFLESHYAEQLIHFIAGFAHIPDASKFCEYVVESAKKIDTPYAFKNLRFPYVWDGNVFCKDHIARRILELSDEKTRQKIEIIIHLIRTNQLVIDKPKANARIIAQQGVFTIHAGFYVGYWPVMHFAPIPEIKMIAKNPDGSEEAIPNLSSIRIPAKHKGEIRHHLRELGIHAANLFPDDLERVVKHLSQERKFKVDIQSPGKDTGIRDMLLEKHGFYSK